MPVLAERRSAPRLSFSSATPARALAVTGKCNRLFHSWSGALSPAPAADSAFFPVSRIENRNDHHALVDLRHAIDRQRAFLPQPPTQHFDRGADVEHHGQLRRKPAVRVRTTRG